jgi:hypothetical protein
VFLILRKFEKHCHRAIVGKCCEATAWGGEGQGGLRLAKAGHGLQFLEKGTICMETFLPHGGTLEKCKKLNFICRKLSNR